jgi:hypothetical protein
MKSLLSWREIPLNLPLTKGEAQQIGWGKLEKGAKVTALLYDI